MIKGKVKIRMGDTIVHSSHGLCKVTGIIEELRSDGKTKKHTLELKPKKTIGGNCRILIPFDSMEKSGIRYPATKRELNKIMKILKRKRTGNKEKPIDYFKNKKIIKAGNLERIAELISDLNQYEYSSLLSKDKRMLDSVKEILAKELVFAKKIKVSEARKLINENLK